MQGRQPKSLRNSPSLKRSALHLSAQQELSRLGATLQTLLKLGSHCQKLTISLALFNESARPFKAPKFRFWVNRVLDLGALHNLNLIRVWVIIFLLSITLSCSLNP
ncbi:unnamed protein product [Citrullus colocynthis]|uniref:Uncharacterized protein n=1 Tax=Citrullus colocynthis TaxID=252529 RepID=A0ABP0YLP8_9ROSI